jgi:hypothetical protein
MAFFDNKFFNPFSKKKDEPEEVVDTATSPSFVSPKEDDVIVINAGGVIMHSLPFNEQGYIDERDLIDTYRELASRPEVDWAIQEIVNEAIVTDFNDFPVSLEIPADLKLPSSIVGKVINDEFPAVLKLLNFNRTSTEKFRQWFIDGKQYYHGIVDSNNPKNGLVAVRWIEPKTIKKVIETEVVKNEQGIEVERIKDTYFVYSAYYNMRQAARQSGVVKPSQAVKVHPDAIAYSNSGLFRERADGTTVAISHLDKALKAANQLRLLEDSLVIYRLSRAPERRIFYVDVGNLPKTKAEQYLTSVMNRFKNKMVYDTTTGELKDQRNNLSMLEDYWLPRREGGRGTEVTTLPGGQNLGELDDVEYFYKKLYRSLNIPSTRLQSDSTFNIGRSAEITREEVKFSNFISFLRMKFSEIFIQLLKIQLVTKNIMSEEDYDEISPFITFRWKTNAYWDELMFNEVMQSRIALLQQIDGYVGKYFSQEWVFDNVLNLSEEEKTEMKKQISKEPKPEEEDSRFG